MRRILAAVGLLAVPIAASPAASSAAAAGVIYGVCGPSICAVDAASGKKRTLLKGTSSKPYTAVSASRSGAKLAYIRGEEVFRAKRGGKSAERVGTALRQTAPEVNMRPDGGAVAWIDVIQRPIIVCLFPPCGFELERNLIALDAGKPAARSVVVAVGLMSAGWLGGACCARPSATASRRGSSAPSPRRPAACAASRWTRRAGSTIRRLRRRTARRRRRATRQRRHGRRRQRPDRAVRRVRRATGCRDLTSGADLDPAFSPDAKRVAFVRGRDLYVVKTDGGAARRLARGVSSPSWAQR